MSIALLCRFTYGKLIARVRMSLFSVSFFYFFYFVSWVMRSSEVENRVMMKEPRSIRCRGPPAGN